MPDSFNADDFKTLESLPDVPKAASASTDYVSPIADRQAGWEHVPENLAKDIPEVGGQMGAMLSFPFARAYEATPMGGSQNPLRDVGKIPDIAKGIVQYYNNEYVQPLLNQSSPDHSVFEERFQKSPLGTAMDLGLLPVEKAIFGAGNKAMKAGLSSKAGMQAIERIKKTADRSPIAKWYTDEILPQVTGELSPDSQVHEHVKNALAQANRTRLDNVLKASKTLDRYWQEVPKKIRPFLTGIGEYTDRDLRKRFGGDAKVQKFLNVARGYNTLMEKELQIPADINLRSKWGGQYLTAMERQRRASLDAIRNELPTASGERLKYLEKYHEDLRNPLTFKDLNQGKHMKALTKMKARMNAMGIQPPVHVALMTQAQLVHGLHAAMNSTLGGISKSPTGRAAQEVSKKGVASLFHLPMKDWPGWLQERNAAHATELAMAKGEKMQSIRQPNQSLNVKDLELERIARMYKFMAIRDFTDTLLKMKPEIKANWSEVNLRQKFMGIAEQTGFDPDKVEQMFDKLGNKEGIVHLPKEVADLVDDVLNGKEKTAGVVKLIDAINRTAKTALFTLDPTFGLRLALQTASLQAWMVKTPKQALGMLTSHILAMHPSAKDAIPDAIMLSHGTDHLKPKMLYAGLSYERMLNALELPLEAKRNFDYGIHNWQRRATSLHMLLYAMKHSPNGNVFADLLNMDRTLQTAKAMTFDPTILRDFQKQLTGYLGDYSSDIATKGWTNQIANRVLLVHAWVRHATNIAKTIPMENPVKLSILHALSTVSASTLQPPDMPKDAREMGFIKLAHENAYFKGWDLDSLRSGLDLLESVTALLWGQGEVNIPSKLSPAVSIPLEQYGKIDVNHRDRKTGSFKAFVDENPDVKEKYGKYFKVPSGRPIKDIKPYTRPNIAARVASNMFTKQMNFIRNMSAVKDGQPHVPSIYTYPGNPAPLRRKGRPIKKSWIQIELEAIGMVLRKD